MSFLGWKTVKQLIQSPHFTLGVSKETPLKVGAENER